MITTLPPHASSFTATQILHEKGMDCSLLVIAPGDESPRFEPEQDHHHVLYVAEGTVTVVFGELNVVLAQDQALRLGPEQVHSIRNHGTTWARVLRIDVPERKDSPPIVTLPRGNR